MLLKNRKAFTLVELLAVVMIVALLTAVAVPQYRKSIQQAETSEALINLRTIFDAAVRYKAQASTPPTNVKQQDVGFFDARVDDNVSYIGNFAYIFGNSSIQACRVSGGGYDTYCFTAYYNHATYGRGAMMCSYNPSLGTKYAHICNSYCVKIGQEDGNVTSSAQYVAGEENMCVMDYIL